MTVNWGTTVADRAAIRAIVERARPMWPIGQFDTLNVEMDITACHLNGTPLKLASLLGFADVDFLHDVSGIMTHMNRETGQLEGHFLPRSADLTPSNATWQPELSNDPADPMCIGCRKRPAELPEYDEMATVEGYPSTKAFVLDQEGTLNPVNGHFACDKCYIAMGQPSGPNGWVAP